MEDTKILLEKSIRGYQNLLEHVNEFKNRFDQGGITAENYYKYNDRIATLQQEVEELDRALMGDLKEKQHSILADSLLMQKKLTMMKEIMEINNYLLPRLASLMDVTKDELLTLRTRMKNINGYHSGTSKNTGRIIRNKG